MTANDNQAASSADLDSFPRSRTDATSVAGVDDVSIQAIDPSGALLPPWEPPWEQHGKRSEPGEPPEERDGGDMQQWLRELHRSVLTAFDEQLKRTLIRQGALPEALAGPQLSVSLADVSLIDWLQAIQLVAKHAVITVTHGDDESRLWLSKGALIDAESGKLRGEAAVYRIVGLERGHVVTELRPVHRERTILAPMHSVLLEAVRRKDEAALLRSRLGDLDRHFQAVPSRAAPGELEPTEAATLRLFDEPRSLRDAVDHGEMDELEALAMLERSIHTGRLIEARVERPSQRPSAPAVESGARRAESVPPLTFARPAEPATQRWRQRWPLSMAVMVPVVALAAWVGAKSAATIANAAPAPRLEAAVMAAAPGPTSFPVVVRADPPDAEIELDGRSVGRGRWSGRLPRDGMLHELRLSAEGFAPTRVLFLDTAPPFDLHLEALPRAPSPAAAEPPSGSAVPSDAVELAREACPRRPRSASPSSRSRRSQRAAAPAVDDATDDDATADDPTASEPAVERASKASARAKRKPFVRMIDGDAEHAAGSGP